MGDFQVVTGERKIKQGERQIAGLKTGLIHGTAPDKLVGFAFIFDTSKSKTGYKWHIKTFFIIIKLKNYGAGNISFSR
jgi:predicted acetyltransferase